MLCRKTSFKCIWWVGSVGIQVNCTCSVIILVINFITRLSFSTFSSQLLLSESCQAHTGEWCLADWPKETRAGADPLASLVSLAIREHCNLTARWRQTLRQLIPLISGPSRKGTLEGNHLLTFSVGLKAWSLLALHSTSLVISVGGRVPRFCQAHPHNLFRWDQVYLYQPTSPNVPDEFILTDIKVDDIWHN